MQAKPTTSLPLPRYGQSRSSAALGRGNLGTPANVRGSAAITAGGPAGNDIGDSDGKERTHDYAMHRISH